MDGGLAIDFTPLPSTYAGVVLRLTTEAVLPFEGVFSLDFMLAKVEEGLGTVVVVLLRAFGVRLPRELELDSIVLFGP